MALTSSQTARLETQLDGLKIILSSFEGLDLQKHPPNGKWSAHEHVCHIARTQGIFFERFEKIITERMPPKIERYNAEEDKDWENYVAKTTQTTIQYLTKKRKELIEYLAQVRPGDLRKKGIHPAFGDMTLEMWIEFFLVHEGHHLYSLLKLLQYR